MKQLFRSHRTFGYEVGRTKTDDGQEVVILQTAPHTQSVSLAHLLLPVSSNEAAFEVRTSLITAIERARFLDVDVAALRTMLDEEIDAATPTDEQSTATTPSDLKTLINCWWILVAFSNEVHMALNYGDMTPEERLTKIEELVTFARSKMPKQTPPSVVADMPERFKRPSESRESSEPVKQSDYYYFINEKGEFEGPFPNDPDEQPNTPEDDEVMRVLWEKKQSESV
ncbi:MAG: hypothetical protein GFH27_549283n399 [Chloroflexi bacterium AL-W]|nr:hypothetical protein [Chloroflexi bacterium AL-N1]NOK64480.1 hypothetical protein [Chloroflexi bacterium AL-N10]NOK75722.1 hypothetical protein [Chloroflexi bacterium AL-N5]NOK80520.1 hypothetical protein [Chloroflexi bacterium AL-W]NOK87034.1 hypothetical protein [Chloroflexi bacterium AL-N15]